MHLLNVAALALLSGSLALAALNEARDEWQPSADSLACLYMTNDYDWAGEGQNLCEVGGQCGNSLPDGLNKNVSSAGPQAGMTCFLYDGKNCTGATSAPIVYPGLANLSDPTINFDKRALSWKCWKYCGYMSTTSSTSATTSASSTTSAPKSISITLSASATSPPVAITKTVGGVATASVSSSSGAERPSATATTVLTHTFADGSTELTTMLVAVPT